MKIYKVLVDELPEKCGGCPLFDTEYYMCWGTGTWDKIREDDKRPDWCPLEYREHILSKDCWCNPTVEDYRDDKK